MIEGLPEIILKIEHAVSELYAVSRMYYGAGLSRMPFVLVFASRQFRTPTVKY